MVNDLTNYLPLTKRTLNHRTPADVRKKLDTMTVRWQIHINTVPINGHSENIKSLHSFKASFKRRITNIVPYLWHMLSLKTSPTTLFYETYIWNYNYSKGINETSSLALTWSANDWNERCYLTDGDVLLGLSTMTLTCQKQ